MPETGLGLCFEALTLVQIASVPPVSAWTRQPRHSFASLKIRCVRAKQAISAPGIWKWF